MTTDNSANGIVRKPIRPGREKIRREPDWNSRPEPLAELQQGIHPEDVRPQRDRHWTPRSR